MITKTEKKIRIRVAKRVKTRLQREIPVTKLGIFIVDSISNAVLFVEKILRRA